MPSDRPSTARNKFVALCVVYALTGACIVPEATCEYTKTCVEAVEDGSVSTKPTPTQDADATPNETIDAGESASSDVSTLQDASLDASVNQDHDATPDAEADAHVSVPQECEYLMDCTEDKPVCHGVEQVCTECDNDFDCEGNPTKPLCKLRLGHEQDNECVQCLGNGDCTQGICVSNQCVTCNTKNDDGCTDNLPHCIEVDGARSCVACATNEHCGPEVPVCAEHQCVLCTEEDATHCSLDAPICDTREPLGRCVGCRGVNDCTGLVVGDSTVNGLCIDEQCTACELGTNLNCSLSDPYCVALMPEADGGVSQFAPDATTTDGGRPSEQYLSYEHQCVECLDRFDNTEESACGGSKPGCFHGSCVECTVDPHCKQPEASVCDESSHECVGCSDVGHCAHLDATPVCDVENNLCVECTADHDERCDNKACQTVPGAGQYTCSDQQVHSVDICDECLSDSHCPNNSACVLEVYNGVETGYRCLPIEGRWNGGMECGNNRPFVGSVAATSVDGVSGTFCKPRSTSCQGYADYGRGTVTSDAGLTTCNTNDDCGLAGVGDGACVPWTETTNRCTYECVSEDDCHAGCNTTTLVDESVEQVCSLAL